MLWNITKKESPTKYKEEAMPGTITVKGIGNVSAKPMSSIEMEPDDIDVSDSVTFVWEIG